MKRKDKVWEDRKRNFLGLPWTFTKYTLTPERLFINTGFLNSPVSFIKKTLPGSDHLLKI